MNPEQSEQVKKNDVPRAKRGFPIVAVLFGVIALLIVIVAAIATPIAITIARNNAARHNLRMVGLAIHNYESTFKQVPAVHSIDYEKKPTGNWRYAVMQYLGPEYRDAFTQPPAVWTEKMPPEFRSPWAPSSQPKLHTNLFTVQHPKSAFPQGGRWIGFASMIDGLNSSLFVIALPHYSKPWTDPTDLTPEEALKLIRACPNPERIFLLTGDSTVHPLGKLTDEEIQSMITVWGGEPIPPALQTKVDGR